MMTQEERILTQRQEEALERLRGLAVPSASPLPPGSLIPPPWWYRLRPMGAALLLAGLAVLPFVWIPFGSAGSRIEIQDGTRTLPLPRGHGTLTLFGPAELTVVHLQRHLLTGKWEGDLLLGKGELFLQADPRSAKEILLRTPLLLVRVTGTELLIGHRPEEGNSRVLVLHGAVQAQPHGGSRQPVIAGEEFTVHPDGSVLLRSLVQPRFGSAALDAPLPAEAMPPETEPAPFTPSEESTDAPRRILWHEQE